MRRLLQVAAFERDKALVAAHVRSLVDGHRQMTVAEKLAGRSRLRGYGCGNALGVEPRAGPHLAGRDEVHDQHAHRPVALRLQNEAAVEFERGAEHDGEHDRLAEQLGDRQRVVVAGQDGVDRGPEPHDAPAQIERVDFERQDRVVAAGLRRLANRDDDVGIHHVNIGDQA